MGRFPKVLLIPTEVNNLRIVDFIGGFHIVGLFMLETNYVNASRKEEKICLCFLAF